MGRKCCVPGCRSNYNADTSYTPSFTFPKAEDRRALWIRSINRADFKPSATAVVCVHHFDERFLIKEDRVTRDDGTLLIVQRKKIALTADAYPSIFQNQPHYLTKELPMKRKSPSKRRQEMIVRDEENFSQWCLDDSIESFEQFANKCSSKVFPGWLVLLRDSFVLCYRIKESECPKIVVSMKIFSNLTVTIWHSDTPIEIKSLEWLLGPEGKCDKWTKFDCLLNLLTSYEIHGMSFDQKLSAAAYFLEECCDKIEEENDDDDDRERLLKVKFLMEQIKLICAKQLRYSSDLLLWSSKLYFCYPSSYALIRNSGALTLPHPFYLKKLSTSLNCIGTDSINCHISYLKRKTSLLNDHEKIVNVLLDEIYVSPFVSYKGGHLFGISANSNTEATTIQTFMIVSVLSKNKDVVALIPVKNLTAETLHTYTLRVLQILFECGYTVLCLISDNNRINRNMFTMMCNSELKSYVENPQCTEKKLFFLFDSVHLIKAVRNNWLNQTTTNQTFYYPDPTNHLKVCCASLDHLKKIYDAERNKVVKQAPKLSQKVLYPTSTERQNVSHALNLFHESNSVALAANYQNFDGDIKGTKTFIDYILKWWKVVNVKHPHKGMHSRDKFCDAVKSELDDNVKFLHQFSSWMCAWDKFSQLKAEEKNTLGIPKKGGMLSKETHFALKFTTDSLIAIIQYVFQSFGPTYILLGKFQTDCLEARFGQYRQMSGGNYNVSCRQILESERKLKILNLIALHSEKAGEFRVSNLDFINSESLLNECQIPEVFYDIFNSYDDADVTVSTMSVLIYISGYVAYKVNQRINCQECSLILAYNRDLECESQEDEVYKYLQLTDRGGLKWPQEFTVEIVMHTFQIFQKLISKKYEEIFLRHEKQKQLIVQLTLEKLNLLNLIPNKKCNCGTEYTIIAKKSLSVIANIFLNNYCKVRNDKKKTTNCKRKLSTF